MTLSSARGSVVGLKPPGGSEREEMGNIIVADNYVNDDERKLVKLRSNYNVRYVVERM